MHVLKVVPVSPRIKITPIFTKFDDKQDIINQLIQQNSWIDRRKLELDSLYTVNTQNTKYKTLIVKCTHDLFQQFLDHRNILFGLNLSRCYEYVDIIQCKICQRYGHFPSQCTFDTVCKNCAKKHHHKECNEQRLTCNNCLAANLTGKTLNTSHRATDHRCPSRIMRLDALRDNLISHSDKIHTFKSFATTEVHGDLHA